MDLQIQETADKDQWVVDHQDHQETEVPEDSLMTETAAQGANLVTGTKRQDANSRIEPKDLAPHPREEETPAILSRLHPLSQQNTHYLVNSKENVPPLALQPAASPSVDKSHASKK